MSSNSILKITDCLSDIDFLDTRNGFLVCEWIPSVAQLKNGGVWQSSPLVDGKRLASRNFDNAVETFTLTIRSSDQDAVIKYIQSLTTMLEKATSYWTTAWQKQPVWLEARGATETNIRYAVIKGYKIEELANPFSQPFFNGCKSLVREFVLVLERDHWLDQIPGTAHRIEINNLHNGTYPSYANVLSVYVSQHADDALFMNNSDGTNTVDINSILGKFGQEISTGTYFHSGLRFPSVTIPQGSTITMARLIVSVPSESPPEEYERVFVNITGELTPNAALFNNSYTDHHERTLHGTDANISFVSPANGWSDAGTFQSIWGLESIIQEIVNQNAWVSGNALAIYIWGWPETNNADSYRVFGNFGGAYNPSLQIYYTTPLGNYTAGREDTDTGKVYVSNKGVRAQLTHIFYNDTGTGFSGNLIGTALPWTLLPAVPANGDEIYFGVSNAVPNYGPLGALAFDILTPSAGYTLNWSFSNNAGGWYSGDAYSDTSKDLSEAGEGYVKTFMYSPGPLAVNGVTGYWIKATVANVSGGTTPPVQKTRPIYTIITPFVDVDSSNIKGEIPALARIRIESSLCPNEKASDVIVGARSKSRGEDFTAYLNFSDVQNPLGMFAVGSFVDDSIAPTGRAVRVIRSGIDTDWFDPGAYIYIDNTLSGQYQGAFHAYLRVKAISGSSGDFDVRFKYSINISEASIYSDSTSIFNYASLDKITVVDCGIVNFGTVSLGYDDNLGTINFGVEVRHNVAPATTLDIIDLILIPCDEWLGAFRSPVIEFTKNLFSPGYVLDIDGTGNPRSSRALLRMNNEDVTGELSEQFIAEFIKMTRGGPYLQINSDQRLWFTSFYDTVAYGLQAFPSATYSVRAYVTNRYLTMRGSS